MNDENCCPVPSEDDLREALKEMGSYVDVTEEDLKKIYDIALRHAQRRIPSRALVKDVMTRSVVTARPDTGLQEAARLLSEHRISGMPVLDDQERVVGVISEADLLTLAGMRREHTFRDLLHRLLGEPVTTRNTRGDNVGDVMSTPSITCRPGDDVASAAAIMDQKRIKRLPVVDDAGKLLGVISRADIVRTIGTR